ncbi:MAG TPA: cobalamin-binding protein [Clostridia bacterium]|nr:cobalamin-binding protein [Clostridia bacterium]
MKYIYDSVLEGDSEAVVSGVQRALKEGHSPISIINEALIKAMDEVGAKMKSGDMFIPEVLASADAMKEGLMIVKPLLEGESYAHAKVVIGTVAGDLHDIGKNLVAMLLESSGFEVVDLGVDVATEKFLAAIEEHKPAILGLSALLTTTMTNMRNTVQEVINKYPDVIILVGGAPVSQEFADEIKAHGYAPDAGAAADLAKRLLNIQ